MRAAAPTTPATPLLATSGHHGSSAVSLHSRSGSQGRNGGVTSDPASAVAARLMIKQDYEAAERQLAVVRRFRNPVVEAVGRLRDAGVLQAPGATDSGSDGRVRDRRKKLGSSSSRGNLGGVNRRVQSELNSKAGELDDSDVQPRMSPGQSRSSSRGRPTRSAPGSSAVGGGKSHIRRQGSHDDIGLSRSQGSYDAPDGDGDDGVGVGAVGRGGEGESGVSAEEEMMRRMWESREVYDKGD